MALVAIELPHDGCVWRLLQHVGLWRTGSIKEKWARNMYGDEHGERGSWANKLLGTSCAKDCSGGSRCSRMGRAER